MKNLNPTPSPDVLLDILTNFCLKVEDPTYQLHPFAQKPYKASDKIIATNFHSLVATPLFDVDIPNFPASLPACFPIKPNIDLAIPTEILKKVIMDFPKVDAYPYTKQKCSVCNATGYVDATFQHDEIPYTVKGECPLCDGSGAIIARTDEPKKEYDKNKFILIGNSAFTAQNLNKLLYVAEILNTENVKLIHQTEPSQPSLFTANEIEVLLMPCWADDRAEIFHKF